MAEFSALILAAGEGKRMKSMKSKVVHKVCGKEMVNRVLDSALSSGAVKAQVVVGHCADMVKDAVGERATFVYQHEQKGTGHAVMQARAFLEESEHVCVLTGDTPLISEQTLREAMRVHTEECNDVTVLTADFSNPYGYGRIIRKEDGTVLKNVEHKDATEEELKVTEINSGMYFFKAKSLLNALESITDNNAQGEYYLTDALEIICQGGGKAGAYVVSDSDEIMGINDRLQLSVAERIMRRKINEKYLLSGVTIIDPFNTYICDEAVIGTDTIIYPGTVIEGKCIIGKNVYIGPNCKLTNAVIGDETDINISTITDSTIGSRTHVGPYAYVRPGCTVGDECKVGDFVELKKAIIGNGTKLSHLTYVGDAEVGSKVNFGCGTVVVNYDGKNKYKTVIKDNAFIGCNSNLVSPVTVNEGAYIAAGSTITDEVPKDALAIARARQVVKENWNDRRKK